MRGYIRSVRDGSVGEHAEFIPQPDQDKLGSFRRNVDPDPLAVQVLGGDAGRCAATERVQHHIAFITGCLDDAFQEGKGFLSGVSGAFFSLPLQRGLYIWLTDDDSLGVL